MESGEPQPRQVRTRRALLCAVLAGATLVNVPGALAAAADDTAPPPPVTTTPVAEPTPDPAPPVTPKPKPVSKPAPRPIHTSPQRHYSPPPARSQSRPAPVPTRARRIPTPHTPTPATVYQRPAVARPKATLPQRHHLRHKPKAAAPKRKHLRVKPKAHKPVHRAKKAPAPRRTFLPKPTVRVSLPLPEPSRSGSGGTIGLSSFLIVLGLICAIACFTMAVVPPTSMRWRPAVIFASERHADLTVAGVALLTIALSIVIVGKVF